MSLIVGVDGCKAGWLAIQKDLDSGMITSYIHPSSVALFSHFSHVNVLALDIPIGLTDSGPRQCDLIARKLLGQPRGSSVFPSPIRPAVGASNRKEADSISRAIDGRGVGAQAFGIYPRVREIDQLLREEKDLRTLVYEVHPELCFMAWNAGIPIRESKKTPEGMRLRLDLIQYHFGNGEPIAVRQRHPVGQATVDDIYDAFAALWTAERILSGTAEVIPDTLDADRFGIPMRMYF